MKEQYEARMVCIHFGEDDTWQGKPLYNAIIDKCRELGMAGATVFHGIEGFGASTNIHHRSLWTLSKDAPIVISVIDREEAVQKLIPFLDEMVVDGLIAMSGVQVIRYSKSPPESSRADHPEN
jgi:PII-like signaling protein